jgi:threonine synthase
MRYISTRGQSPEIGFTEALLAGLARDGGLYVPKNWPVLSKDMISGFVGQRYADVAKAVLGPLVLDSQNDGDIAPQLFSTMIEESYAAFRHKAVCPLVQIDDNLFVLELFHGPTLAFKDVAMQLLARMMSHALAIKGERATIIGATSGDTGSAAVEAFKGLPNLDVFILYPHGRVSEVQRRQMTTVDAPNIHAIALEGTFDDAQDIVKGLFNHASFRDEVGLSGVNSINWARIAAQIVYYFTSATSLGSPGRPVSFSVPTGNFGDIFAGYAAKQMGLPIHKLMVATNENDILARTLHDGFYELRGVIATSSPSMDIQVSSNFERLLFDVYQQDDAAIRGLMASLKQSGRFDIAPKPLENIRKIFSAIAVSEAETAHEIASVQANCGVLLDPHTSIGVKAARSLLLDNPSIPVIALATAHPAKFPDATEKACGLRPPLPPHMADLYERKEQLTILPNDQTCIEEFIRERRMRG